MQIYATFISSQTIIHGTFSESRSTLSEILLSDTRTSVFCCLVSIIIIGMLASEAFVAEAKATTAWDIVSQIVCAFV